MIDNVFRIRIDPEIKAKYQKITNKLLRDEIREVIHGKVNRDYDEFFPKKVYCPYCHQLIWLPNDIDERITNRELHPEPFEVVCEYCKKRIVGSC